MGNEEREVFDGFKTNRVDYPSLSVQGGQRKALAGYLALGIFQTF